METKSYDLRGMASGQREEIYQAAGEVIRSGGTVVFPTETVYGLGADGLNPKAVAKIFEAKGRPSDNPLILHVADRAIDDLVTEVPRQAQVLMDKYWPGPLTLVLKKSALVPLATTGGLETVGLRMPDQPAALALIRAAGGPIAAPSANLSGRPSPTTFQRCREDLAGRVDMILGMDSSRLGLESTILDLSGPVPELLRPGAITLEMLQEDLGEVLDASGNGLMETGQPRAPGMKYRHYAPRAKVVLFSGPQESVRRAMAQQAGENCLRLEIGGGCEVFYSPDDRLLRFPDLESAAHDLFETLRWADDRGFAQIYIQAVSEEGLGRTLMNRLVKASGHDIRRVE